MFKRVDEEKNKRNKRLKELVNHFLQIGEVKSFVLSSLGNSLNIENHKTQQFLKLISDDENGGYFILRRIFTGEKIELQIKNLCELISLEENSKLRLDIVKFMAEKIKENNSVMSILENISKIEAPRIAGTAQGLIAAVADANSAAGFFKGMKR